MFRRCANALKIFRRWSTFRSPGRNAKRLEGKGLRERRHRRTSSLRMAWKYSRVAKRRRATISSFGRRTCRRRRRSLDLAGFWRRIRFRQWRLRIHCQFVGHRHPRRTYRAIRKGSTARRDSPAKLSHDKRRTFNGPGAQPPLQKVPATGNRPRLNAKSRLVRSIRSSKTEKNGCGGRTSPRNPKKDTDRLFPGFHKLLISEGLGARCGCYSEPKCRRITLLRFRRFKPHRITFLRKTPGGEATSPT